MNRQYPDKATRSVIERHAGTVAVGAAVLYFAMPFIRSSILGDDWPHRWPAVILGIIAVGEIVREPL